MAIDGHYWGKMREHDARRRATVEFLISVGKTMRAVLDRARTERMAEARGRFDERLNSTEGVEYLNTDEQRLRAAILCGAKFAHGGKCAKLKNHQWGCSDSPLTRENADAIIARNMGKETAIVELPKGTIDLLNRGATLAPVSLGYSVPRG